MHFAAPFTSTQFLSIFCYALPATIARASAVASKTAPFTACSVPTIFKPSTKAIVLAAFPTATAVATIARARITLRLDLVGSPQPLPLV